MEKRRAPLVGLYSPAPQSGKSTLAAALAGFGWQTVKFAAPMKGMIRALLREVECPEADIERMIEGDLKETPTAFLDGRTPRFAMQTHGTEWGRKCMGEDFWVRMFMAKANALRDRGCAVIVDDMRFPNEFDAVKAAGGVTVRVTKPGVAGTSAHASEGALDGLTFDMEVVNDYPTAIQYALDMAPKVSSFAWTGALRV